MYLLSVESVVKKNNPVKSLPISSRKSKIKIEIHCTNEPFSILRVKTSTILIITMVETLFVVFINTIMQLNIIYKDVRAYLRALN